MNNLRRECQSLCEHEDLDESRKLEVQQSVRDTDEQWKKVLQAAEDALNKAETQAHLGKELDAFKTQSESVQSWIQEHNQNLWSVVGSGIQPQETLQIAQVSY